MERVVIGRPNALFRQDDGSDGSAISILRHRNSEDAASCFGDPVSQAYDREGNDDASVDDNSDGNAFEEQEQGEEIPFIGPNTPYSGNYPEDLSHQEIRQTAISNSPEGPHNDVDTYGGAKTKDCQTSLSRIESLDGVPDHGYSNNLRARVGIRHTGPEEDVSQTQVSNGSEKVQNDTGTESR